MADTNKDNVWIEDRAIQAWEQSIEETLSTGIHHLRFPFQQEERFQEYYAEKFSGQIRFAIFLGLLVFSAFGVIDSLLNATEEGTWWHMRYYLSLPVLLFIAIFTTTHFFSRFHQVLLTIMTLVMGFTLIALVVVTPSGKDYYYFMGLLLLEMLCFILLRMRFWAAAFCAISLFVTFNVVFFITQAIPLYQLVELNFFYIAGSVISLIACYFIEYYIRKDYLHFCLVSSQKQKLDRINRRLETFANIDGLTQVANRRMFDKTLHDEWSRCKRQQVPIGLLMLDIDYFKRYNDHYGHQRGDECLKTVAELLQRTARRAGDCVARYGGEEFGVILPNTDVVQSKQVAQHIINALSKLKLPHEKSEVSSIVSVSIGVAALVPSPHESGPLSESLVTLADEALYSAKEHGRNRAKVHPACQVGGAAAK